MASADTFKDTIDVKVGGSPFMCSQKIGNNEFVTNGSLYKVVDDTLEMCVENKNVKSRSPKLLQGYCFPYLTKDGQTVLFTNGAKWLLEYDVQTTKLDTLFYLREVSVLRPIYSPSEEMVLFGREGRFYVLDRKSKQIYRLPHADQAFWL